MTTVSLIRATAYDPSLLRSSLESLLKPLGGIEKFVKPGDRVLLKPNLLTGNRPGKECLTRPEIAYCIAQLVQEAGGKPFLGDSPAFGSAKGVARNNGYLPLMEKLNIPIVEFKGKRYDLVSNHFDHLRLSKEAMDADVVINLPKVKSHAQLTITLGVKNLFGCVPGKMKAWWHMEAGKDAELFATMLIETARTIAPNLTIIDGIIGHEGNGPSGGEPRNLGVLAASDDVFALDQVLVDILNVSPQEVPTVAMALKIGLCGNLDQIDFPLLHPNDLRVFDWKLPDRLMPIDFGLPRVIRSSLRHFLRLMQESKVINFALK
jgi:uncharacterized protein (DUF362 family)